ncbi:hypothetical protein L207DRAFT_616241 [Hyaloscypha variabilis F]|uniref:Uncharacterized protein n=1 Tax=Hyaloscypha variabilis (strain UAMH 11265 / GT02V1 / F) TaxID=1149755 RepID=A0A2J6S287_HYAVF|nr:hypothetical protein L207DRAFT_616241 [Hyaloscypha variabilis F]
MCGKIWSSWFYSWMATVDTSTFNPPFQTSLQYMTSEGLTIAKEWDTPDTTIISIWQTVEVGSTFLTNAVPQGTTGNADFTASPPCCRMCSFSLGAIQVYHWPTTGPPAAPTLTNSVGYTFVYPSIYIAFKSIRARDLCGMVGTSMIGVQTIGFDQPELSTATSYWYNTTAITPEPEWHKSQFDYSSARWDNLSTGTDITTTIWTQQWLSNIALSSPTSTLYTEVDTFTMYNFQLKPTGTEYESWVISYGPIPYPVTYNPCKVWLSVPTKIYSLQSAYKVCSNNIQGLFDPPINIDPAAGFFPITKPAPPTPYTTSPSPIPAFTSTFPTRTAPPVTKSASPPHVNPPNSLNTQHPTTANVGGVIVTVYPETETVALFKGSSIEVHTSSALIATIGGTEIAVTKNSLSQLVGTVGGSTITFSTNSDSALVGTFGGATITASAQPELVGTFGGSTITFTTDSNSQLVGSISGSTVIASTQSELVGTIGGNTITFTSSNSQIVWTIGGSTVTANLNPTSLPGPPESEARRVKSISNYGVALLAFWMFVGFALYHDFL